MAFDTYDRDDHRWIDSVASPAFVLHECAVQQSLERIRKSVPANAVVLYTAKALHEVVPTLSGWVDGYSVSSVFEARHARESAGSGVLVQYVSPLLRRNDLAEVTDLCDRVTLNSTQQLDRFGRQIADASEVGLRVNPGLSFIHDARYDPCRRGSKLGVPLQEFAEELRAEPLRFASVSGVHFHTNCDSDDLSELVDTIGRIESALGDHLKRFRWLNVGGGYSFADDRGIDQLKNEFGRLSDKYSLEIVIEPGAAIVRSAGCFVSSVADIVEGDDYPIAVLDLSVNHWPEVFEYQFEPDVEGHVDGGRYTYLLAGCSCLAGDLFGVYSFHEPLELGSRVVFPNAGAYSIVKAHMFNGINLPSIYALTEAGELALIKRFTYEDFLSRCGVDTRAAI